MLTEAQEQQKVFDWARISEGRFPELKFMFHIPNGGSRNKAEAANLRRQGVKPGVPDIFLPAPRGSYHGLWIEMKVGKNKPTAYQNTYIDYLNGSGYRAVVCYGADEAIIVITEYLKL